MKQRTRPGLPTFTVRARSTRILEAAAQQGWSGDTEIGRAFGVSRQTAWRILRQNSVPPLEFIAGALASMPSYRFEDLFEVVPDNDN